MTKQLLSVDGFRTAMKDGEAMPPDAMVVSATDGAATATEGRRIKFVFSDGTVDRAGDTINPSGWELDSYRKNPVVLFGHDSSSIESVIGKTISVGTIGNKLVGEVEFATLDINPCADMALKMVKAGLLSAVSVGFLPTDFAFSKERPGSIDFRKQTLLELSLVPVPCNENALITARSMGIDVAPLKEWAEKIIKTDNSVLVPKPFLEATFRAAKTPRSVRNKYLSGTATVATHKAAGSDWKVGAARDLPLDDSGAAWDGPAAAASIFASAGFDGDSPDSAKARRGFLIYDSANPALKGSYKLPFARVSDGTMKAMPSGIRAAASRLPQTDAPSSVLDDARKVIDGYETKMQSGDKSITKVMETHRDMGAVAALAWLLDRLADIEDAVEAEENAEGDGSGISARIQAAVASLGQILVDMTAEEVAELASDSEDDDESDDSNGMMPMMMSARTPAQKALMRLAMIAQSKAGRVLSAANSALLEQAKACHTKALDCMDQGSTMMGGAMDQHQKAMAYHQEAASCIKSVLGGESTEPGAEVDGFDGQDATDHIQGGPFISSDKQADTEDKVTADTADMERQRRNRARARALELSMPI